MFNYFCEGLPSDSHRPLHAEPFVLASMFLFFYFLWCFHHFSKDLIGSAGALLCLSSLPALLVAIFLYKFVFVLNAPKKGIFSFLMLPETKNLSFDQIRHLLLRHAMPGMVHFLFFQFFKNSKFSGLPPALPSRSLPAAAAGRDDDDHRQNNSIINRRDWWCLWRRNIRCELVVVVVLIFRGPMGTQLGVAASLAAFNDFLLIRLLRVSKIKPKPKSHFIQMLDPKLDFNYIS